MRYLAQRLTALAIFAALSCMTSALAAELSAAEIIAKAYHVDGGRDGIARLSFNFQKPGAPDKKLVFTMVWKEYGEEGDVDSKVVFFSEFPPDERGKSFMAWVYKERMDDQWIYLPELRMVRKVSHGDHKEHENDDFAHSVLTRADLVPRKPGADEHTLLGEEEIKGRHYYVVESIPKKPSEAYPYQKVRRWISKDIYLIEHIDYYSGGATPDKQQEIKWERKGDAWVWTRVLGVEPKGGSRTVLDISDIRVNLGLKEDVFSARTLRLGVETVR